MPNFNPIIGGMIAFIVVLVGLTVFPYAHTLFGTVPTTGYLPWEIAFTTFLPYGVLMFIFVLAWATIKKGGR